SVRVGGVFSSAPATVSTAETTPDLYHRQPLLPRLLAISSTAATGHDTWPATPSDAAHIPTLDHGINPIIAPTPASSFSPSASTSPCDKINVWSNPYPRGVAPARYLLSH